MSQRSKLISSVAKHLGLDEGYVLSRWQMVRRGEVPPQNKFAPEIGDREVIRLTLACLLEAPLKTAQEMVDDYLNLTNAGLPAGGPMAYTAEELFVEMMEKLRNGDPKHPSYQEALKIRIDIVRSWREISFTANGGQTQRCIRGGIPGHWQGQVRNVTQVTGTLFKMIMIDFEAE